MALYFPVVSSQPLNGTCIGNFFSPNTTHLVIPENHDLEFRHISSNGAQLQTLKINLVAYGTILAVKSIPQPEYDLLVVLSQLQMDDHVKHLINIKKFDPELKEFVNLHTHEFILTNDELKITLGRTELDVLNGLIFFSNGTENVYFIDPENKFKPFKHTLTDHKFMVPVTAYFINNEHIALVQESSQISHVTVCTLKFNLSAKLAKKSLSLKTVAVHTEAHMQRILCVALAKSTPLRLIVFHAKFATVVEPVAKKPSKIIHTFELKTPPIRIDHNRSQTLVCDNTQTSVLTSTRHVYRYLHEKEELQNLVNLYDDYNIEIEHINGNYFKRINKTSSCINIARYTLESNMSLNELVLPGDSLKFDLFKDLKFISHSLNTSSKKNAYFATGVSLGPKVLESQMSDALSVVKLDLPLNLKNLFSVGFNNFVFTTSNGSKCVQLTVKSDGLVELNDTEMRLIVDERTLYATKDVQVTPTKIVNLNSGEHILLPFAAVAASVFENLITVASVNSLFVVNGNDVVGSLEIKDTVLDIACNASKIAVLTLNKVRVFEIQNNNTIQLVETYDLPTLGFCIEMGSLGEVLVSLSSGAVVNINKMETVYQSLTPFRSLRRAENNPIGFYASEPLGGGSGKLTYFQLGDTLAKTASVPGCVNAIEMPGSSVVLAVGNLNLYALKWSDVPVQKFREHSLPVSFDDTQVLGDECYLFDTRERILTILTLQTDINTKTHQQIEFPPLPVETTESQFKIVEGNIVIEVAKIEPEDNSDEDSDRDFWDDDGDDNFDFNVKLFVRIYRISNEGKLSVITLNEKQTEIEGDPDEAVVVKFWGPLKFSIFAYSAQCITCEINDANNFEIKFGRPHSTETIPYYDKWMPHNNKLTVVEFSGKVYNVNDSVFNDQPYPKSEPICFKITKSDDENVFDVVHANGHYLAVLNSQYSPNMNRIVLFEFGSGKMGAMRSFNLQGGMASLGVYDGGDSAGIVHPKFFVGTPEGNAFCVCLIPNLEVFSKLKNVESEIIKQLNVDYHESDLINGELLISGLNYKPIRDLFAQNELDPVELDRIFSTLRR